MARPPRLAPADGSFHVWTRGNRKQITYADEIDHSWFVGLLAKVAERYAWNVLAYCLMSNHYHIAVHTPDPTLSAGMQLLNGAYARRFNWRHGYENHLFGRRFGSVMAESTEQLMEQVRYVVLNPVRAGLCSHPGEWPASSYNATVGHVEAPLLLAVHRLESIFGGGPRNWQVRFAEFVASGIGRSGRVVVPGTERRPEVPGAAASARR